MNPRHTFAVAYLAGTLLGVVAGASLPFWLSGAAGYLVGLVVAALCFRLDVDRANSRALFFGSMLGAFAGAIAADVPEVARWFTYAPIPDVTTGALLVAAAWLVGEVVTDDATAGPPRPLATGLVLYAIVLAIAAAPIAWGVLR